MKIFSPYPGCHKFRRELSEFSEVSTRAGCGGTNILGYYKGRISHLLRIDLITEGSILLTANLVALKRKNPETILTVKRTKWKKLIYFSGRIIEAEPSRVGKKKI